MSTSTTTWAPVELRGILDEIISGEQTGPLPTLLARTDGVRLLYLGELHSLAGEPESGKGWIALSESARVITNDERVLYIDFEDTPSSVVQRLLALGAAPDAIAQQLVYVQPADPLTPGALKQLLDGRPFTLAVLDGMSEAYALLGLDSYSNSDVPKFLSLLPRPIAASGAAVLLIDHVTKSKEGRGRWAIGAQHKLAGIAVAYGVEVLEPPSRLRAGKLKLTIQKDRHGHVRGHAAGATIALARIEPADEGESVTVTFEPPDAASATGEFRPTVLMERASRAIEETPGLTSRELREHIKGTRATAKDAALQILVREHYIEVREESRGAKRHYSMAAYRQADDLSVSECVPSVSDTPESAACPVSHPLKGGHGQRTRREDTQNGATVSDTLLDEMRP